MRCNTLYEIKQITEKIQKNENIKKPERAGGADHDCTMDFA